MYCVRAAFGVGGASNFNLKLGAGKREEAAKYIGNAITLLVGSGVVLAVFVLVFLKPLMIAFGATDIVLKYALILRESIVWVSRF